MDILTSLPQAPAPEAMARPSQKNSQESRVEESGAISFSGWLEKNQERTQQVQPKVSPEADSTAGEKTATEEDKLTPAASGKAPDSTGANPAGTVSATRPVMIGQMLRIQMASPVSSQEPAPVISTVSEAATTVSAAPTESAAQVDVQPTGGDSTPAAAIDLSGLKALKTAPTGQSLQTVATSSTQGAATPVPQAVGPAETLAPEGTPETPASVPEAKPATSGSASAAATVEKMVPEQPVKSGDTTIRPEIPGDLAEQIPAKVLDKGQTQRPGQTNLKNLQAEPQAAPVESIEKEGSAEDQASLSDAPPREMSVSPEVLATLEKPVKDAAAAAAPVDSQPRANVDLPEGMIRSQLEPSSNPSRVSSVLNHSSTRTAALDQGNQIRQQVIHQLSSSLGNNVGHGKMTLLLNPENLGQVEIQFSPGRNDLSIVMTASNPEAEQALREGLKELADGIVDKSARWQHVDIKVDGRNQDQEKNESRQDKNRDQSRREGGQGNDQEKQDRQQDGMPDWASLRQEG